jgi:hypothetical protein
MKAYQPDDPRCGRRVSISQLGKDMAERAVYARQEAMTNPSVVEYDEELLPWVFCENDGLWYSFDGNYSQYSPAEKRQKALDAQERRDAWERLSDEKYHNQMAYGRIREFILNRDNRECQLCGARGNGTLHVHHIRKRNDGGPDTPDNLITVCPKCHRAADGAEYNPNWTYEP